MKFAVPYRTFFGDVDVDVTAVTVDDDPLPFAKISRSERTVALYTSGKQNWNTAVIRLAASLPEQDLDEGPWEDPICVAILTEKATNARSTQVLAHRGNGTWEGKVELARSRHSGRVSLDLAVVAKVDGVAGRLIGSTAKLWFVDLKAKDPVRQREIEIRYEDFRQGPDEWLRPFKEAPWIVDTTGDIPVVYLNTGGVEGLVETLAGAGGTVAETVARDLVASHIAHDAWTAMFHSALSDLDQDEDGTPLLPPGWRGQVLRMMLPDVMPDRQLTDALYEIAKRRQEGYDWSRLQTSINFAAGKRSRVSAKLTKSMRSIHSVRSVSE